MIIIFLHNKVQDSGSVVAEGRLGLYIALYTFKSDQPGDLSFEEGEIIHVTKAQRDWWIGSIGDRTGTFPANFVREVEAQVSFSVYLCIQPLTLMESFAQKHIDTSLWRIGHKFLCI